MYGAALGRLVTFLIYIRGNGGVIMTGKNRKTILQRIVWLLSGILLGASAILCFIAKSDNLIQIAPFLGMAMLATGILNLILYVTCLAGSSGAYFVLADSITAALLSLFPMFNKITAAATIPFFFCVWDLFSGVLRVVDSLEQKEVRDNVWKWFLVVGVIEILVGCAGQLKPVEDALTMHVTVGSIFLVQAIAFFHKIVVDLKYSWNG